MVTMIIKMSSLHIGEFLFLKREPTNQQDTMAVAIVKQDDDGDDMVVKHMPRTLAPTVFYILSRSFNSGTGELKGQPLNRGAGMGMEVPCI